MFYIYLAIGTMFMLVPIMVQRKWYNIGIAKAIILAVVLTITGTIGTYILSFIESGQLGGISFFGAVFFVPIAFLLFAKIIRIPYGHLMDICAPAECVMLVVMKVQCLLWGCCYGMIISVNGAGEIVRFPSQIVELINALIISVILLVMSRKVTNRGKIYPWYLIIYGVSRFFLNMLRETTPMLLGLGYGSLWAAAAFLIGIAILIVSKRKSK